MRFKLWLLSLVLPSLAQAQYYTPAYEDHIDDWENDTPLNVYDQGAPSMPPPVHVIPDTSLQTIPLRPAIGEVITTPLSPVPSAPLPYPPGSLLRPALPMPLPLPAPITDAMSVIQTNLTNFQREAGKEIQKNILAFEKGVIIPLNEKFEANLKKLFNQMKKPPIYRGQTKRRTYCYWSVRTMLERSGFAPPGTLKSPNARDAGENLLAAGFKRLPWVKNPAQAPPGAVLVYGRGPGHAEIVGDDGYYVHYLRTRKYGGNQRIFKAAYFPPGAIVKPPGSGATKGS